MLLRLRGFVPKAVRESWSEAKGKCKADDQETRKAEGLREQSCCSLMEYRRAAPMKHTLRHIQCDPVCSSHYDVGANPLSYIIALRQATALSNRDYAVGGKLTAWS